MANIDLIKVHGFKELERKLANLPKRVAQKALGAAVKSGAVVVAREARKLAPAKDGTLKKSIKVLMKKGTGWGLKVYQVGSTARHAHLVELGTARHVIRPKGKKALAFMGKWSVGSSRAGSMMQETVILRRAYHPGAVPKPFLRPAFDNTIPETMEAIRARLAIRIHEEAKKL